MNTDDLMREDLALTYPCDDVESDMEVIDMSKKKPSKDAQARGKARAAAMTPEQRKESARHAALQRWSGSSGMELVKETHAGTLSIGEISIACSVLEDGTRVLSTRGVSRALGSARTGTPEGEGDGAPLLPAFLAAEGIKVHISDDLMVRLRAPIVFKPKQGGRTAFGYRAELLPEICKVVLKARREGTLKPNQRHIAEAAEILVGALANVGIIALVDEATGYQADRARDELQKILEKYIAAELLRWTKKFPDEFFKQVYRVHGWKYEPGNTKGPRYVGKIIKKYIYGKLPPGVLQELENKNPPVEGRRRFKHFQWLTNDTGHPHLDGQILKVTTLLQVSDNPKEFERHFQRAFPQPGQQTEMPLDGDEEE